MKYYIGIDGGGTKTHCVLCNEKKEKIYECFGGPANFLMLGTEQVSETIYSLVKESIQKNHIRYQEIEAIMVGATGAGRKADADRLEADFRKYCLSKDFKPKNIFVESDARIALEGAFSGRPGCILIAGTGSILYGKDAKGRLYRVGGFGRFIGDEGSGYMIGKKGLNAVAKAFDGRGDTTLMLNLLQSKFNINSPEELISEIYKNNFDIAAFAPAVLQAAGQGDAIAKKIIEEETEEILLHLAAIKKKLLLNVIEVSLVGSLITNNNYYNNLFLEQVKLRMPEIRITSPENNPAVGAVLYSINKLSGQN